MIPSKSKFKKKAFVFIAGIQCFMIVILNKKDSKILKISAVNKNFIDSFNKQNSTRNSAKKTVLYQRCSSPVILAAWTELAWSGRIGEAVNFVSKSVCNPHLHRTVATDWGHPYWLLRSFGNMRPTRRILLHETGPPRCWPCFN